MQPAVGMLLDGFCNGYFGRDSYGEKRIEGFGVDWIVVREDDGTPNIATFDNQEQMSQLLEKWHQEGAKDG